MYKGFVTFLVLIAIATAQCPASYDISNLLAGTRVPYLRICHLHSRCHTTPNLHEYLPQTVRNHTGSRSRYVPPHSGLQDFST